MIQRKSGTESRQDPSRSAVFSEDGIYRWWLGREWDPLGPILLWIMLNPSKASALVDDATIRRIIYFSRAAGYGSLWVGNLFAYISTDPKKLDQLDHRVRVGPQNDEWLSGLIVSADAIVCAWGAHKKLNGRDDEVLHMLQVQRPGDVYCFGVTKDGAPRHPVRLPNKAQLQRLC